MKFKFIDPETDFSNGLEVIKTYHRDFLNRGKELLSLVDEIIEQGINEPLANRCVEMHCYYFHTSRLHHFDEEYGLFPLLVNQSQLIDGMIERLTLDHEEIEEDWNALAKFLGDPERIIDKKQLKELAVRFEKGQREHLMRENEDFLPEIDALLTSEQKRRIGETMASSRQAVAA